MSKKPRILKKGSNPQIVTNKPMKKILFSGAGGVSFQPDSGSMLYSKSHEKLPTSSSQTSLDNTSIHDGM